MNFFARYKKKHFLVFTICFVIYQLSNVCIRKSIRIECKVQVKHIFVHMYRYMYVVECLISWFSFSNWLHNSHFLIFHVWTRAVSDKVNAFRVYMNKKPHFHFERSWYVSSLVLLFTPKSLEAIFQAARKIKTQTRFKIYFLTLNRLLLI